MEHGWLIVIVIGVVIVLVSRSRRNTGRSQGVIFVRAFAPKQHTDWFKNIVVLAVLGGLGWFFWWMTIGPGGQAVRGH